MSLFKNGIKRGTRSAQPAANTVIEGALYRVTDEHVTERSTGSAWENYGSEDVVKIAEVVTSGSQATVDFSSIPAGYRSLRIEFFCRDTQAGTNSVVMRVRINNDSTAGNYTSASYTGIQNGAALNSTNAASSGGVFVNGSPQDGNTAGITGSGVVELIGYADTTFHKRINSQGSWEDGTSNNSRFNMTARWKSTAAINRVTFTTDGTAFKDGSVFVLYAHR